MPRNKVVEHLRRTYPSLRDIDDLTKHLHNTISTETVRLPRTVFLRAEKAVNDLYTFAHSEAWLKELRAGLTDPHMQAVFDNPAPPSSVLMSYDFHYDFTSDQLSLIEINTNASMYIMAATLYEVYGVTPPTTPDPIASLRKSFESEWGSVTPKNLAIVDIDPPTQKMFFEFKMFTDLFRSWGVVHPNIFDRSAVPINQVDFVYNRLTDFYLSEDESKILWHAWSRNHKIFSPHPREYLLMGDKQRLIDFSQRKVSEVLVPTVHVKDSTPEELWNNRKKLFFKPKNAFGGKAAYRGGSISSRVFNELIEKDYVAQEFRHAGKWAELSFDLRFFVYKTEIQVVCARLYHGQLTNFSAPGGGIAPVIFE